MTEAKAPKVCALLPVVDVCGAGELPDTLFVLDALVESAKPVVPDAPGHGDAALAKPEEPPANPSVTVVFDDVILIPTIEHDYCSIPSVQLSNVVEG